MPLRSVAPRHLAAVAVLVFVLEGCGGGSSGPPEDRAVVARWAGGLRHWGAGMTGAINGISILFSRPADVRGIQNGNHRIGLLLQRYERTFAGCSARVERLGAPPASLGLAKREALHACVSLERAAVLIGNGVAAFRRGLGPDGLDAMGGPLSAGEDGIRRAQLDLGQQ